MSGTTTRWTPDDVRRLSDDPDTTVPLVSGAVPRILAGEDVWDPWPIQEEDGTVAVFAGGELWMALAAPAVGHPEARHDVARLRLLGLRDGAWSDLGPVFADGASAGSREWSGSAIRRADGSVSVFYTAAGHRGEPRASYAQRVFEARMRITADLRLEAGGSHREILRSDGRIYMMADELDGGPGTIRAFRDPSWFRDPATGRAHLLVAASVADGAGFAGAVAIADADDPAARSWTLRPPLLDAEGLNHELERPHVIVHDERYYLFCCAHRYAFHGVAAPTGLYGFVADRLGGPYAPLNGSGLVVGNPAREPDQAYAWLVLPDMRIVAFLNYRGLGGQESLGLDAETARAAFGGTVAPVLRLTLDGARTAVAPWTPSAVAG